MVRNSGPVNTQRYGNPVIGDRLKEERERLGMTIPEFATAAGAKKNTVIDWQNGTSSPPAAKLAALASVGVDVVYVLTGMKPVASPDQVKALMDSLLAGESDQAIGTDEGLRRAKLVAVRALMTQMTAPAFDGCVKLVVSYSRISPDDQAALVRHGAALDSVNDSGSAYRPKLAGPDQPSIHDSPGTYTSTRKKPSEAA